MAVDGGREPTRREQRRVRSLHATGREPLELHTAKSGSAARRLVRPVAARSPSSVYARESPGEALHNKLCYFKATELWLVANSSSESSSSNSLKNSIQKQDYYVRRSSCLLKTSREEPPASYRHQAKLSTSDDFRLETCKLHGSNIFWITCRSCAHTHTQAGACPNSRRLIHFIPCVLSMHKR